MLLGLVSALSWGTADFLGGRQARHLSSTAVAFWSQAAGGVILLVVLVAGRQQFGWSGFLWGMGAGAFTGGALILFYRGLASGEVGMVAPISACGVIIPVAFALLRGDAPSTLQVGGIVLAVVGVVLVSLPVEQASPPVASRTSALLMAIGAAVGFGLFYVFVDEGTSRAGAPLWVIGGARLSSFSTIGLVALLTRTPVPLPRQRAAPIALTGVLDTSANGLFAYATTEGNVAVVSTFASLYPVATILLAWTVASERLTPLRAAGAALALAGVVMLSAG